MRTWIQTVIACAVAALLLSSPADAVAEVAPKEAIGWHLFFDKNLSGPKTFSCASCHLPEKGYEGGEALSKGAHGDVLARNTPTVVNLQENEFFFWDGRAGSLAEQAKGPMTNPKEMDVDLEEAVKRISSDPAYRAAFSKAGVHEIDADAIFDAIASFEMTLKTGPTRFDRWVNGDRDALTEQEERGRSVFFTKGDCALCHNGANFADDDFHNVGTGTESDRGRYEVEKDEYYLGAFKTPALRNWKLREPFMHDGRFKTLREVIDFYVNPPPTVVGEREIDPIPLTAQEIDDLIAFLEVLNGDWPDLAPYKAAWQRLVAP
jgi:cytochrome c peroxidase